MTDRKSPKVLAAQMMRYDTASFDLIPLHLFDDERKFPNGLVKPIGKAPRDAAWTTRRYDTAKVRARCIADGRNVGVRLRDNQLVIDVDPRNGGNEGFASLCHDIGIDEDEYPRVVTGSGGFHAYWSKPADVKILNTLESYSGVEFKSKGQQVVAAGSVHPNGKHYVWSKDHPRIEDGLPKIPTSLLKRIARPDRSGDDVTEGGQYTCEEIAAALAHLNAEDFNSNDKWLRLMQAVHHASAGDARGEWIEFSTSDSDYADQADIIGRRWDSLHADRNDGVTFKTLNMTLRKAGAPADVIIEEERTVPSDEFPEVESGRMTVEQIDEWLQPDDIESWMDGESESQSILERMNQKYCAVFANGRYRIMTLQASDGGTRWTASSKADFIAAYENKRIERDTTGLGRNAASTISVGEGWQTWPDRKTAHGTCFDTKGAPGDVIDDRLNLWTGFTIKPEFGDCDLFTAMIRDDLCAGDPAVFDYVRKWIAWKLQNPGLLPQVAIVFVGNIGAGKTTLGETLASYFGIHGLCVDDMDAITGKFNGHLESVCFLYADEAMWGGDKKRVGPLKKLITDTERSYQYKGVDTFRGVNRIGLMMGSNEDWVVPAGKEERRYCVSRVSDVHYSPNDAPADSANRMYWNAIHHELRNGGRAAFLYEMLTMQLGDWRPYAGDVPKTRAMAEQKLQGLSGFDKFYFEALRDGELPGGDDAIINPVGKSFAASDWKIDGFSVRPAVVATAYREWLHFRNPHAIVTDQMVLKHLAAYGWRGGGLKVRRERAWFAPSLSEARTIMARTIGDPTMFDT